MLQLLAAVALLVIVTGVLAWQSSEDGDAGSPERSEVVVSETVAPTTEESAVMDVVDRFVEALATADYETLYELQTDSYKERCSREEFLAIARELPASVLSGPARVAIDGDVAAARVYSGPESARTPVVLPLQREGDGSWRVVAQSLAGCGEGP